jgi:hypothetical protein
MSLAGVAKDFFMPCIALGAHGRFWRMGNAGAHGGIMRRSRRSLAVGLFDVLHGWWKFVVQAFDLTVTRNERVENGCRAGAVRGLLYEHGVRMTS